ncbi:MAG: leucine-rich repeat domain-containing protein, partial [Oscillospiraceae bacterium]|nr:leucine-rich repeat domain-containing protein [Oscillospiraceae bacterium]
MKSKRLISAVTALSVAVSSVFSQMSVTAGAEAAEYSFTYEKTVHTLTASEEPKEASGLYVSANTDISIQGLTKGVTTFGELTSLYSGLTFDGFTIENCSAEGLTEDDFQIYIFMMYGDDWTWYQSSGPDITFSDVGAGADTVVRALGYVLRLKDSKVSELDLSAGDTIRINANDSLDYYTYDFENDDLTIVVEESQYNEIGLSAAYVEDFKIPGVEYGVTTVGELKEMYCGYRISGYSYKGSSLDAMTESDICPTVVMMTGNNAWNAMYNTTTMDFSTGLTNASNSDVVLSTSFQVAINNDSVTRLQLMAGDSITINPTESTNNWTPNFKYNSYNGDLSFDYYIPETDPQYQLYYNIYFNDEFVEMSMPTTFNLPSLVAMQHIANSKDYSGDIEIKIAAADVCWNENGKQETILAYADTTYTYTTDGCSVNEDLAAAGSVYYDEERRINWSVPNNAVNCIYSVYVGGAEDGYIRGYYYGYQSDYGMTTDAVVNSGKDDATITIYNVDINGCISEPVTEIYSMLPKAADWTTYLTYNEETSALSFYQMCPDPSYPVKVNDRAYELYLEGVKLDNIYSSSTSETVTHYTVLGDITSYNFNHPDEPIVEGLYNGTITAFLPSGDYPVTAEPNDFFTLVYNGCVVDPELGVPQNIAIDPTTGMFINWDEVEDAIGYIVKYEYTLADGSGVYTTYSDTNSTSDFMLINSYRMTDIYSDARFSVCAMDDMGNISEFSPVYIYKNGKLNIFSNNLRLENDGLYWDEYEGADHYIVRVTDGNETVEDECGANNATNFPLSMALAGFENDTYTLNVYAVVENGDEIFLGDIEYEFDVSYAQVDGNTYIYTENTDGSVTITNAVINTEILEIPSKFDEKTVSEIGTRAFAFNSSITELVIPEGVKKLGWYAFNYCENLETVTLPDSLEYIDSWAFERCDSLTTIHIPANVSTVMGGAFAQNHSLTSITCDADNENYVSADGVLFTKDMSELVAYPGGKSGKYTVPASVHHIGDAAFYGAGALESVEILGVLDFIGFEAFAECKNLTDVRINDGVTYVGYWAFRGCDNIKMLTVPQSVTNIGNEAFGYADYDGNKQSGFTLRGYYDSAIYYYALRHDIPFISIGEADEDNRPFNDNNSTDTEIETNPDADEDDIITSLTINPAFNLKDKSEAGVGLDLSKINVKANEIYDGEGLERAEAALGEDIVGNKHYNLLSITLLHDDEDISNGYDGLIKVIIPIPKGHRDKEFYCYRLLDDGTKEIIPGKRDGDCYVVYLEHFSVYALVGDAEHLCDFSENWSNNSVDHWHECSCGIICGIMEHTASDWIIGTEATAASAGYKYKECTVCGYILDEAEITAGPANIKATAGDGKVTFTWDAVAGAERYSLSIYDPDTGK